MTSSRNDRPLPRLSDVDTPSTIYPSSSSSSSSSSSPSDQSRVRGQGTIMDPSAPPSAVEAKEMLPPHTAVGQISFAPTTQTTVVTTTTTTTTSFPPFVMKAPRRLGDRDPEKYPLASSPTPASLKRLRLDLGTTSAYFQEAEDAEQALTEHAQKQSCLSAHGGTVQTIASTSKQADGTSKNQFPVPSKMSRHKLVEENIEETRKQSATPISVSEAAELDSFHRRNTSVQDGSLPGSFPQEHESYLGQDSNPEDVSPPLTLQQPHPLRQNHSFELQSDSEAYDDSTQEYEESLTRRAPPTLMRTANQQQYSDTGQDIPNPRLQLHDIAGQRAQHTSASATPPMEGPDYETFESFRTNQTNHNRPAASMVVDTSPLQDASLPSPSLSPITAAATFNRPGSSARIRQERLERRARENGQNFLGTANDTGAANDIVQQPRIVDADVAERRLQTTHTLPTSTFTDIPAMLDAYDSMPDSLKTYVMYQLLRRSSKQTLHFVADVIAPALKCDFFARLPLELSLQITKYLDAKTMCRAAQVSKKWRRIIDSDEAAWKSLIDDDGFKIPEGEIERAIREGWGWQFDSRLSEPERQVGTQVGKRGIKASASPFPDAPDSLFGSDRGNPVDLTTSPNSPKRKRKASSRNSSHKKQKKRASSARQIQSSTWMKAFEVAQGPNAYANAAAAAIPDPEVGLRSLKNLHLFKSIYQRHFQIRQSWMDADTKPLHLAFRAHQRHVVTCLQFDSEKILTGSDDANIDIYDTQSGASLKRLEGHEGGVWALEYHGNILVSGSTDRSVRVWNMDDGRCLQVFQGHTSTVRCLQILQPQKVGETADGKAIMMPRQPLIITGSRDSTCRVWKLPKLEDRTYVPSGPAASDFENPFYLRTLTGHHHSVRAIAAHTDTLVSGSYDATVRVWKISTGELVHRLQGHSTKVYSVVLDSDRNRCISGSMDNLVKVWSLETGSCLFNLEGHTSLVGLLDLKDDCLVSAAADSTLRVWDPENGRCRHILSAHTGAITCFSHDGQKVISGSDRTLKMWNIQTGECVRDLLTDLSGVWQVKFDARRCIAAVQRHNWTYIEVLDFGAFHDGTPTGKLGRRTVVDSKGREIDDQEIGAESDVVEVDA